MTRSRTLRVHFHWRFHLPARMLAQKHILHSQHPQFTKGRSRRQAWAEPCATGAPLAWGRHDFDAHQDGLHNCQNTPPVADRRPGFTRWLLVGHRVGGPGKISDIRFDRPRFAVQAQAITTADLGHSFRPAPLRRVLSVETNVRDPPWLSKPWYRGMESLHPSTTGTPGTCADASRSLIGQKTPLSDCGRSRPACRF